MKLHLNWMLAVALAAGTAVLAVPGFTGAAYAQKKKKGDDKGEAKPARLLVIASGDFIQPDPMIGYNENLAGLSQQLLFNAIEWLAQDNALSEIRGKSMPRLIGEGMVRELAYTGRTVGADEARQIGLVNRTFDDQASLLDGVMEIAREIAAKSPIAVSGTKEMLSYMRDHRIDDGLARRQLLEYINSHEEIQFFLTARSFHICRAHSGARACLRSQPALRG